MSVTKLAREWQDRFDEVLRVVNQDRTAALASVEDLIGATERLNRHTELRTYLALGHSLRAVHENRVAAYFYETVINLKVNDPILEAQALRNLADIEAQFGATDEALDLLNQATELLKGGPSTELGKVYLRFGDVYRRLCQQKTSFDWFVAALACFNPKDEIYGIAAHNVIAAAISLIAIDPHNLQMRDIGETLAGASRRIRTSPQYASYSHWLNAIGQILAGYPKPAAYKLPGIRVRLDKPENPRNHLALTEIDEAQAYHQLEYPAYRREALLRAASYYPSDHPSHEAITKAADGEIEPWEIRSFAYAPVKQATVPDPSPLLERILPRLRTVLPGILRGMLKKQRNPDPIYSAEINPIYSAEINIDSEEP